MEYKRTEKTGIHSKVCVLMSTYCGEKFLTEQLDSIRNQKGVDVKLIVRDDGSPDGGATMRLLRNYKQSYPEFDMEIQEGENLGWAMSFMQLVYDAPIADYYAFADQDDIWLPEKLLEALLKLADIDNRKVLYCSGLRYYIQGQEEELISKKEKLAQYKHRSLMRNMATGCTCVFTPELRKLLLLAKGHTILAHDYFLFLTATFLGKVIVDERSFILYRIHGGNQIGIKNSSKARWCKRFEANHGAKTKNSRLHWAQTFLDCYEPLLDKDDISIFQELLSYKKNIWNRVRLLISRKFIMDRVLNTIFVKMRILVGTL